MYLIHVRPGVGCHYAHDHRQVKAVNQGDVVVVLITTTVQGELSQGHRRFSSSGNLGKPVQELLPTNTHIARGTLDPRPAVPGLTLEIYPWCSRATSARPESAGQVKVVKAGGCVPTCQQSSRWEW